MYEFTHIKATGATLSPNEIYIRCTYMDEWGEMSTGISINPEAIPELITYLQSIISEGGN
jgi:hypothetical protein